MIIKINNRWIKINLIKFLIVKNNILIKSMKNLILALRYLIKNFLYIKKDQYGKIMN